MLIICLPLCTYDRLGRLTTINQGGVTTSRTLDYAGDLLSESYAGGPLGGQSVTNAFDQYLRRSGVGLSNQAPTQVRFGYDAASRLSSVTNGSSTVSYNYLANSPLVNQIAFNQSGATRMTTSKQYDYLNRLSSVSSSAGAGQLPVSSAYQYNAANQRTRNTQADGSFWQYQYDSLGQVISGHKVFADATPVPGQQFDYAFDDIGNRTQSLFGGDQSGANQRTNTYAANNLNQYTSGTVAGYVNVIGASFASNSVTVNGQAPYRKGEYFREELPATNGGGPDWQSVTVNATGQSSQSGHMLVPPASQQFSYDQDGNLTNDTVWVFIWDAENRLVQISNTAALPTPAQRKLEFVYDFQGRRIQKLVSTNNGTAWGPATTNRFVYDGWNLIAILNATNGLDRSFVWGLDLSGSVQGAGGVGGLLEVSYAGTNCFVAYDGNGNVTALVNAADGTVVARYEYGPFGELIRKTGAMANAMPFRFSTRYQDDETDLLYYGYRYERDGRWICRDPKGEQGGANLYCFGHNDLNNVVDPLGRRCCSCTPGDLLASITLGERQNIGDKTGQVTGIIGDANDFIDKVKSYFPNDPEIKKVCKQISSILEDLMKKANLTEKATIGGMELYYGGGYSFEFQVTIKFVCCGKNNWPGALQTLSQTVQGDDNQDFVYSTHMPADMKNFATDLVATEKEILQRASEQCKAQAK